MAELTPKQLAFCREYLVDLNATAAAIRAGYSPRTAKQTGHELMHDRPSVQACITKLQEERARRVEITSDAVVKELAKIAFGDPRKVMTWGPGGVALKSSGELTDDEAAMVSEVSETTTKDGGSLKLKTCDKIKALELIGRHLGIFIDKGELKLTAPLVINMPPRGGE